MYKKAKLIRAIRKMARTIRLASTPLSRNPNVVLHKYDPDAKIFILRLVDKTTTGDMKDSITLLVDKADLKKKGLEDYLNFVKIMDQLVARWSQSDSMTYDNAVSDLQKVVAKLFKAEDKSFVSLKKGKTEYKDQTKQIFKVVSPTVKLTFGFDMIQGYFGKDYYITALYNDAREAEKFVNKMREKEETLKNITPQEFHKLLKSNGLMAKVYDLKARKGFVVGDEPWADKKEDEDFSKAKGKFDSYAGKDIPKPPGLSMPPSEDDGAPTKPAGLGLGRSPGMLSTPRPAGLGLGRPSLLARS